MRVCAIIPVGPSEPNALAKKSIESLAALDCCDIDFAAYYVIDKNRTECSGLFELLPEQFHIALRNDNRGRRAGALNDVLHLIEGADYIAVVDVDSRPNADFVVKCVRELEANPECVLASGCRFVTNKVNTLTKLVSIEYNFFCDMYRLLNWSGGFMQFNGAIGVSRASFLRTTGFDERASCEDLDLNEKTYLSGNRAVLAATRIGEQAPTSVQDLYRQRVRWFRGAVEGLRTYLRPMLGARVPPSVKVTWLSTVTIPFLSYLFVPFVPLYLKENSTQSSNLSTSLKILLGSVGYLCLMTLCGTVAVAQHLAFREREWTEMARSEV